MKEKLGARRTRRAKYAALTAALIALTLVLVILVNVLISALAEHFGWFPYMGKQPVYALTDETRAVLSALFRDSDTSFSMIFCMEKDKIPENVYLSYIHDMGCEIAEAFPDRVTISYVNIWREPSAVRKYVSDGTTLRDDSLILDAGERWSVLPYTDFFELSSADYTTIRGFNGNSRFATAMTYLSSGDVRYACLTSSHGEAFGDYEVKRLLSDAGYVSGGIDLSATDIPEECSLLVTYAPTSDLLAPDGIATLSERARIETFLARGGHWWVFLDPAAGSLPNLEALLADWGLLPDTHTVTAADGTETIYRYMIRNDAASLTADGYTILGVGKDGEKVVFPDATSVTPAGADGKTLSVLFTADRGAEAFAAGKRVESGREFALTVRAKDRDGGEILLFGSTAILRGAYLQSVVYGNRNALLGLLNEARGGGVVLGIPYSTLPSTTIESITTRQMRILTITLALIPAVLVTAVGAVVLVRRKRF